MEESPKNIRRSLPGSRSGRKLRPRASAKNMYGENVGKKEYGGDTQDSKYISRLKAEGSSTKGYFSDEVELKSAAPRKHLEQEVQIKQQVQMVREEQEGANKSGGLLFALSGLAGAWFRKVFRPSAVKNTLQTGGLAGAWFRKVFRPSAVKNALRTGGSKVSEQVASLKGKIPAKAFKEGLLKGQEKAASGLQVVGKKLKSGSSKIARHIGLAAQKAKKGLGSVSTKLQESSDKARDRINEMKSRVEESSRAKPSRKKSSKKK